MKIMQKIKNYHPNKYICYLYFFIPIFIGFIARMDKEADIFFLLRYGEQVWNYGFPLTDFLSLHQGFHFVMQQWLSSVIFYLFYHLFGHYGLLLIVNLINISIIYMIYKFCMLLSDSNYKVSIFLTCITDLLLETNFIVPRPFIFDFLLLVIVLYIMEVFYKKKSNKILLWLPLISLLQINLHSSTWFMLFLFMLPYIVSIGFETLKNHDVSRIYRVLGIMILMFLVGFINPYGIKNITYLFTSYGNEYINQLIIEMFPPLINSYGFLTFFIMGGVLGTYIYYKKEKLSLRYGLLLLGVTILNLLHLRNLSLYIIGAIPPLSLYLKNVLRKDYSKKATNTYKRYYKMMIGILSIYIVIVVFVTNNKFTNPLEKGIDYLLEHYNKENIVLYADYNNGSYCEFRGLKPYIDGRAEIFLKENNKKENILKEYYLLSNNHLDYKQFVNKYQFTHLILSKKESLYYYISNDKNYTRIYRGEDYEIYEKKK